LGIDKRQLPTLQPRSRKAWRAWLKRHHASSAGIWLVYAKKHTGLPSLTYADAVEEALCFGWIDSLMHPMDESHYRQIFTPRKPSSAWSPLNKRRVEKLIAASQMTPAGLKMIELAKTNGKWDAHAETEALTMPPELRRAFDENANARKNWPTYTVSQQKAFLRMLHDAKTPETRAKRIARIIDIVSKRISFSQVLKAGTSHRLAAARSGQADGTRSASRKTRPTTASRARGRAPSRRPR
jgi:uncharacterized protein YdeI (YjbR/CyaY-like superfamily)